MQVIERLGYIQGQTQSHLPRQRSRLGVVRQTGQRAHLGDDLFDALGRDHGRRVTLEGCGGQHIGATLGQQSVGIMLDQLYLTTEGIFGIPLYVSATYVMLFILFGAFVERSGAGQLFMDFALALAGHTSGGPAKVAVITSSLFGTVSGSAVANVMTTGTFTIPLMKRTGYRPAFSGAVEAVASTGGQLMPPIMGAAAFVMAEFLGVSYLKVAAYALLPAILYYVAVFMAVHFEAKRLGLKGLPRADLPRLKQVLSERGHLFLPLFIIVAVLMSGRSAAFSALVGILVVVPTTWLRASTRRTFTWRVVLEALESGARNTLVVALACGCAGIFTAPNTMSCLAHVFEQEQALDQLEAFASLKSQGKVIYVGSSNFAGWHIATANQEADRRGMYGLVSEQSVYNLNNRMIELEVIPACVEYGMGLIPYSPVAGGMLAGAVGKEKSGRRGGDWITNRLDRDRAKVTAYEDLCRKIGHEPAQVAIAWLYHNQAVTAPIIGPRTLKHLEDAVKATEISLDKETLDALDKIFPGPGGVAPEAYAW